MTKLQEELLQIFKKNSKVKKNKLNDETEEALEKINPDIIEVQKMILNPNVQHGGDTMDKIAENIVLAGGGKASDVIDYSDKSVNYEYEFEYSDEDGNKSIDTVVVRSDKLQSFEYEYEYSYDEDEDPPNFNKTPENSDESNDSDEDVQEDNDEQIFEDEVEEENDDKNEYTDEYSEPAGEQSDDEPAFEEVILNGGSLISVPRVKVINAYPYILRA
jgi:hypothetical protein